MRLLFLTHERALRGGERQVRLLGEQLTALGHEVVLGAPRGAQLAEGWPGPVVSVPMANALDLRGVWAIRGAVRRLEPKLVHAFTARAHALAQMAGVAPLVVTRAVAFTAGKGWGGAAKYRRGVARFIAISKAVSDALVAAGADPTRIRIVAPGVPHVEANREAGARLREERLPGVPFVLAAVGALGHEKGFDVALSALAQLPDVGLLIAGEGGERANLEAQIRAGGLASRVALLGQVADVAPVLGAADAFVMPSRSEGFGMALVEAMGAGLPAIASVRGGLAEILTDGVDGLLVPGEDPQALAHAIQKLQDNPALCRALGERACERARTFEPERLAERTLAVYGEALEFVGK